MSKKHMGRCACGQVTYGFDTEPTVVANCHCPDCKRASGGEMATFAAVPETDFTVLSGSTKSFAYGPNTETCAGQGLERVEMRPDVVDFHPVRPPDAEKIHFRSHRSATLRR